MYEVVFNISWVCGSSPIPFDDQSPLQVRSVCCFFLCSPSPVPSTPLMRSPPPRQCTSPDRSPSMPQARPPQQGPTGIPGRGNSPLYLLNSPSQPVARSPRPMNLPPRPHQLSPRMMNPYVQPGNPLPRPGNPPPRPGNPLPRPGNPLPRPGNPLPRPGNPSPRLGNPLPRPGNPSPRLGNPLPRPGIPSPRPGNYPVPMQWRPPQQSMAQAPYSMNSKDYFIPQQSQVLRDSYIARSFPPEPVIQYQQPNGSETK